MKSESPAQKGATLRETRGDQYRDLLEAWTAWWNNIGRFHFTHYLVPPITTTGDALACSACHDVGPVEAADSPSGRCEVCHRRLL